MTNMPWYTVACIAGFVGAIIGVAIGILIASWMQASYADDEKHGRQEWQ